MPPRTEEEKARRRAEWEERRKARLEAKARKEQEEKASKDNGKDPNVSGTLEEESEPSPCYFLMLPEDAQNQILSFLAARDLGAISMTCKGINFGMAEARIFHFFSRVNTKLTRCDQAGHLAVQIKLCENESEARAMLSCALDGSGDTGRLITKKSKKGKKTNAGDADEYIAYARFLEEAIKGYTLLQVPGKAASYLPPIVNGRFASVSPEHSLCRVGGDGYKSGAGGSGCASWGVGKRGQLGHGKRKDEGKPRMLLGGIGYGLRVVQVSAGGGLVRVAHSLLLTSTGRVLSFGTAQYGQLGHGYSAGKQLPDVLRPKYIKGLSHLQCTCVSAGELHSAVVTTDGDLYTWGDGFCGQLGLGDKRPKLVPQQVAEGGLEDECVLSVSCGARHTLVVTEDGEVFSFGLGHFGVLGRSYTPYEYFLNSAIAGLGVDEDVQVEVAEEHRNPPTNIAQLDDTVRNQLDLLTNLTLDDSSNQCVPKIVDSLQGIKIVAVSAGHRHSMFLDEDGNLYTCGDGSGGALGHGSLETQHYPMMVMYFAEKNIKIMQISAGVDVSMAVSTEGEVYGWGNTKNGCIGVNNSKTNFVSLPDKVTIKNVHGEEIKSIDVEAGYLHSLIIGVDGSLHLCGNVDIDENDLNEAEEVQSEIKSSLMEPAHISNFNIWHRIAEPKEENESVKWKKYGKYELKGRSAMMAEKEKWNI